jgi:hypothetical protein
VSVEVLADGPRPELRGEEGPDSTSTLTGPPGALISLLAISSCGGG